MKLQLHRAILFSVFLFVCPRLTVSQQPSISEPKLTHSEAETLVKDLASQEEALAVEKRKDTAAIPQRTGPPGRLRRSRCEGQF